MQSFYFKQGVHTSPKGLVSSSGFVFGENLAERVQFNQDGKEEKSEDNGVASPDSTEQTETTNNNTGKIIRIFH